MKHVLKVVLVDGSARLINEDQICTVDRVKESGGLHNNIEIARIRMSSGEVIDVVNPPYGQWEADTYFSP